MGENKCTTIVPRHCQIDATIAHVHTGGMSRGAARALVRRPICRKRQQAIVTTFGDSAWMLFVAILAHVHTRALVFGAASTLVRLLICRKRQKAIVTTPALTVWTLVAWSLLRQWLHTLPVGSFTRFLMVFVKTIEAISFVVERMLYILTTRALLTQRRRIFRAPLFFAPLARAPLARSFRSF